MGAQGARLISACSGGALRPQSMEVTVNGEQAEVVRHCYVCDEWLPLDRFWGTKRICRECQSQAYRKPATLLGVKVVHNPPPKQVGKCIVALCTMAAVIAGLCRHHDWQFRWTVAVEVEGRSA